MNPGHLTEGPTHLALVLALTPPTANPVLFALPLAAQHSEGPAGGPRRFLVLSHCDESRIPGWPDSGPGAGPSSECPGAVRQPQQ